MRRRAARKAPVTLLWYVREHNQYHGEIAISGVPIGFQMEPPDVTAVILDTTHITASTKSVRVLLARGETYLRAKFEAELKCSSTDA